MPYDIFLLDLDQKVLTKSFPHIFLVFNLTLYDLSIVSYSLVMLTENLLVVVVALSELIFILFAGDIGATPSVIVMQLLLVQIEACLTDNVIFRCISSHLIEKERKDLSFLAHAVGLGTI